ncbi:WD40 repeat-containing protein [Cavenderia fasciculata]|uniref:Serine-threonine kinase receptor-associated protein n=1 Tax=Cavenderia fasciculata TaxID=261658 RepID=F4PNZ3_CACFS|nr:WD40 repeat-containing protein [Cavenderia fasciculata]EGG22672.1 WD40 repeat-containing protein [Cavenderia fasciculata]|eukprot:XP_004360523.1 WD40 repeat-containing protein [Cavenderia fasciculata]
MKQPLICSGHSRPVSDLAYCNEGSDGCFIISACLDGKPMLRDGSNGDWIGTFEGHKGAVWSSRFNSTATQAITASADYTAKLWDTLNGTELYSFEHDSIVKTADFSRNNNRIVTGGADKVLRVFDLENPTEPIFKVSGHNGMIKCALWSVYNDDCVLSGGADEVIRIWDLRSQNKMTICAKAPISSMEFSKDKKLLLTTAGNEVTFWDAQSFHPVKVYSLPYDVHCASLHPDGSRFIAGGSDFWVHVYDSATGNEIEVNKGHHGPVNCCRYSSDGESFASGSVDGTIRIWNDLVSHVFSLGGFSNERSVAASIAYYCHCHNFTAEINGAPAAVV